MEEKKRILTGDRPTGKLHLGHYVGSLRNRVKLQDEYNQFVMLADVQALTDNADNPQKVRDNLFEVALDYLAVGIDPEKTTIFIQSLVPEIAELTIFFLNLVTVARLERNPTVKEEIKQKGYERDIPAGFLCYPVSQAADILFCKADLVPVGADQAPMIEQTNEIANKFNTYYGPVFKTVEHLIPQNPLESRLPGLDGKAKMSKSLGNAIFLSDPTDIVKQKVMSAYTDPGHVRIEDPGKVEGNVVFSYLDMFHPDKTEVAELKAAYTKGGLGDVAVKNKLFETLETILTPIRQRREEWAAKPEEVIHILAEGTKKARAEAEKTMHEVRTAMKIGYF